MMIKEWFWERAALTTPLARKLGFARDFSRYKARWSRNAKAWQSHLDKSSTFIREAARQCIKREMAIIAGSGMCLDIPLEELSSTFRKVVLIDVVHPREVVQSSEKLGNVQLCLHDLTDTLSAVAQSLDGGTRLPIDSMGKTAAEAFAKAHPELGSADLVVSANTLSQLPLVPTERLWTTGLYCDAELESFASNLIANHVAWLRLFACPSILITDLFWISLGQEVAQTTPPLYHTDLGEPLDRWEWQAAPKPEAHPERDILHVVGAFTLSDKGS
ncbi:MAG: hypothetical protein ACLGSA_14115 [Acidobacteriota bacterium]